MRETVKRGLRITGGVLLLVLGVLGLFLPILQGWLFLGMGLLLLFPRDTRTGRRIRAWLKRRREGLREGIEERMGREPRDAGEGSGGDDEDEGPPPGGGPSSRRRRRPF
ncbi:MAG: hypothetical protein R6W82_05340 [bacterium]